MTYDEKLKIFREALVKEGIDEKVYLKTLTREQLEDKFVEIWHRESRIIEQLNKAKTEIQLLKDHYSIEAAAKLRAQNAALRAELEGYKFDRMEYEAKLKRKDEYLRDAYKALENKK